MKGLYSYIERCIKEAHDSVYTYYDSDMCYCWYVVVDDQIILDIKLSNKDAEKRVMYRLERNIKKHFDLEISNKYITSIWISHSTVGICQKFGYDVFINNFEMNSDEERRKLLEKAAIKLGRDGKLIFKDFVALSKLSWEEFREVYHEAFNEYPSVNIRAYGGCNGNIKQEEIV